MSWKDDIASWAAKNGQEPETVGSIATGKGWEPNKYQPSMKRALFDYLDQWYTLSVKTLPAPATKNAKRRNPARSAHVQKFTKLSNGWKIWILQDKNSYTHSTVASNGTKYLEYDNNTLLDSMKIHKQLIKKLKRLHG